MADLICSSTDGAPAQMPATHPTIAHATAALPTPGHQSSVYHGSHDWIDEYIPADAVVIHEKPANHGNGIDVLYADGRVE